MLLRLAAHNAQSLQVRICFRTRSKCLFFVFRHCDNKGHPLVGGWHDNTLTLPKVHDNQWFTSLIKLFRFMAQAHTTRLQVPRDWASAFQWAPGSSWHQSESQPFQSFLQTYNCHVHDEPPYDLYFNGHVPKAPPPPRTAVSFDHQFQLPTPPWPPQSM